MKNKHIYRNLGFDSVVHREAVKLSDNRIVILKRGQLIEDAGYFIVEVSTYQGKLMIAAYDVESQNSYLITYNKKGVEALRNQF